MDQGADIEQVIANEIEALWHALNRLTEGPIPLRVWCKRAGSDLFEETEEHISHLRRTIRIYEAILADMNRRQPGWRQPAIVGGAPLGMLASATS